MFNLVYAANNKILANSGSEQWFFSSILLDWKKASKLWKNLKKIDEKTTTTEEEEPEWFKTSRSVKEENLELPRHKTIKSFF